MKLACISILLYCGLSTLGGGQEARRMLPLLFATETHVVRFFRLHGTGYAGAARGRCAYGSRGRHRQVDYGTSLPGDGSALISRCEFPGGQCQLAVGGNNSRIHDSPFVNNRVHSNRFHVTGRGHPEAHRQYPPLANGASMSVGGDQNYVRDNTFVRSHGAAPFTPVMLGYCKYPATDVRSIPTRSKRWNSACPSATTRPGRSPNLNAYGRSPCERSRELK